jgi:hypothetical protein
MGDPINTPNEPMVNAIPTRTPIWFRLGLKATKTAGGNAIKPPEKNEYMMDVAIRLPRLWTEIQQRTTMPEIYAQGTMTFRLPSLVLRSD